MPGSDDGSTPAPGSVVVRAVVLPSVILVVDAAGRVQEVVTNDAGRDARDVVYLVRRGNASGAPVRLTRSIWSDALGALAHTRAGTGSVWTR